MRPNGDHKQLEKRRRQAMVLLLSGKNTYREVAQRLGASLSSVVRWCQAYRKKGPQGIRCAAKWGRPCLLADRQKERLKAKLLRGAAAAGYTTDLWTLKRIAGLIRSDYGVDYTQVGVWKLLRHDFGWSCQKPERRATQREEEEIAHWRRTKWPHIKKSPTTWGPSGLRG